jgi:Ran GTPase-activating protein (RanGAP) involved in mRNA processing and transport
MDDRKYKYIKARGKINNTYMLNQFVISLGDVNLYKRIDISDNALCDDADQIIKLLLAKNLYNAEDIDFSGNKFGPKVAQVLVDMLPRCNNLSFIDLSNNKFNREHEHSLEMACSNMNLDIIFEW